MRGLRSFLVLLTILVALGAYLYFVESKRDPNANDLEKVFALEADQIREITVTSESDEKTTLRKEGDDWKIVEPVKAAVDTAAVSGITSNLATLEVQRVIEENPGDLAEYGLADPRVRVAFKAGDQQRELLIGNKTPIATDLYAKLGDSNRVFLISSFLDTTFNKTTFDLRDKSLINVDRDAIDSLTVKRRTGTLAFSKSDGQWRLTAPIEARADYSGVESLVSRLNTLQMRSIEADEPSSLDKYGLDEPEATVQIGSGASQATLLVGDQSGKDESTVYAKVAARPAVVTIDKSLLDELKKEAAEFRQKDLFDARTFNATRLEIARGGRTIAFEKTKVKNAEGQEEEQWRRVAPEAGEVDESKVESLLSTLTLTRAESFVDTTAKTGLDEPELTATIAFDEGKKQERVSFGRQGDQVYASRADDPGAAKLGSAKLDEIIKAVEELQK